MPLRRRHVTKFIPEVNQFTTVMDVLTVLIMHILWPGL